MTRKKLGSKKRRALRDRLAEAQNWRCAYCHCLMEIGTVTVDHVFSLAMGGDDDWANMVAACRSCNESKGHATPANIKAALEWRLSIESPRNFNPLPLALLTML